MFNPANEAVLSYEAKESTRPPNADVTRADELEYCPRRNWLATNYQRAVDGFGYDYQCE